ncbi:DUF1525 domain-containing protein [Legionella feeleii]|uniref:DUF1525 domain-containing protein n=1 Tax=Legionella feeleii TaxID=453 RepID=UPI001B80BD67|nr:DUF1525 domain-containing protein [Legionella feeleii]
MKRIFFMTISLLSTDTSAARIEVFTTSAHPVALNGVKAQVCVLDALTDLTAALNRPGAAIAKVGQVDSVHNARLTAFYRCQAQAGLYGLASLPAIVIDRTYVAYGLRSVDKALIAGRRYSEVHHD